MVACPSCGESSPERFNLCGYCGAPLARDRPRTEIRRTVTVVTSDLKGSTSLGEKLDPESLREVLNRYFDEMRLVFESHGGTIEKIIGDAIIAVFGLPTRHDDDPQRAVAAAAESLQVLANLNDRLEQTWGVRLTNRTGIATGEVIVGEASAGQHVLVGDTMRIATAMEQNAPALEALVAASTYRLVRSQVQVERVGAVVPKGLDKPIRAYRLICVSDQIESALHRDETSETTGDARICANCGEENPAAFNRCGTCGATLATATRTHDSRKTVTIVFADPKPTMLAADAPPGPEAMRDAMSRYFDAMRHELEKHGGTVEKFIGDAVMAVFGLPIRHEDDALRAVRAAADMQRVLPDLNDALAREWGLTLANHIGVNTGEVVAGDAGLGQRLVTGDAVNVAARLEQAAGAREILIGPLTHRLVREAVEVEPVDPLTLKGKAEPVPAYRFVELRSDVGAGRRHDSPLVGRAEELRVLETAYGDAVSTRKCRIATLVGDAGVGKTRLTKEILERARNEATVLASRCLPYGDGITFWPIAEVVRSAAGIADNDLPDVRRAKIDGLVGDGNEAVAERIASVVGLSTVPFQVADLFWGIRRLFELLVRERPVVVLFDDIHWAEQTFLDLLEYLASSIHDAPIMVLCTARHELLERAAEWGTGPGHARIVLQPLSDADAGMIVENLLGQAGLDGDTRARIVRAAEGNPLFVEQLLSMLMDNGQLRLVDGRWTPVDLSRIAIPPTIHALIAARLDGLPEQQRGVVEPASVIGLLFPQAAVEALVEQGLHDTVSSHLSALSEKRLIRPENPGTDGEAYRFGHLLIRDAAYAGLLKRSRAILHERFVAWADEVNEEQGRTVEFEEILGYHLEQAHRYHSELGPLDEHGIELGVRASKRLSSAGHRALGRGDMPAAANLLRRASNLLPNGDRERPRLRMKAGEAQIEMGDFKIADETLGLAIQEAAALGDMGLEASADVERTRLRYMTAGGGGEEAIAEKMRETMPILMESTDEEGLARAWRLLAFVELTAAQWGAAERAALEMLKHARNAGDRQMEVRVLPALALFARYGPRQVNEAINTCLDILKRTGSDRRAEALTMGFLAVLRAMNGEAEEARRLYRRSREMLDELGSKFDAALVSLASGPVEMLAGEPSAAERELRRDYETLEALGERNYISTVAAYLAEALYRQGRIEEAAKYALVSHEVAAPDDVLTQIIWRSVEAKILAQRGKIGDAEKLAREAVATAQMSDDPTAQGNALVDLAEVFSVAGRHDEAAAALASARAAFAQKGDVASLRRVDERVLALPPSGAPSLELVPESANSWTLSTAESAV